MPDEKLPWDFKDANLTIRQQVIYLDGKQGESDYTVLNPDVLRDEKFAKKGIYPNEIKLGNFLLSTISLFRDVGIKGLNKEMLRRVFIGDDGKLLMFEVVEVGGNEVRGIAPVRGREIFEIHKPWEFGFILFQKGMMWREELCELAVLTNIKVLLIIKVILCNL